MFSIKNTSLYLRKFRYAFPLLLLILAMPFALFPQCANEKDTCVELKILSWNIYMIPHIIMHTGQVERAKEIIRSLENEEVDVIVFEEAFYRRARKIIRKGLKNNFPYESGNPTKNIFYKTNSGVWVISKVPINIVKRIYFKNGRGTDQFACKGAMLIEGKKGNFRFQLVATHLQSDLENQDVHKTRKEQYQQLSEKLLKPYAREKVPQFVVGDMNTSDDDSLSFKQMLSILDVKQCVLEKKTCFSYDCSKNDFIINHHSRPQLLDHIFFNKKGVKSMEGNMLVKVFRKKWNKFHSDLSDHFAVLGTFLLD
jgi:endonuclease/exonuclease/phosphatase family metal-dependent hydrolase